MRKGELSRSKNRSVRNSLKKAGKSGFPVKAAFRVVKESPVAGKIDRDRVYNAVAAAIAMNSKD